MRAELDALVKAGASSAGEGLYLFRRVLKPEVERRMAFLREKLMAGAKEEVGDTSRLQADFAKRFSVVLGEFAKKEGLSITSGVHERALAEALGQFKAYLEGDPFTLRYAFFLPVLGGQDEEMTGHLEALAEANEQPPIFHS